jgi:hypothetical protein
MMAWQTVTAGITIESAPDTIWAIANDPRTYPRTIDWVYDAWWEDDGDTPREGAVYVERAKPGPKEGIYRWTITAYEPPRRAVHSHRGRELEADLELVLQPLGDGRCHYTQTMRFRALPGFRPLGFVLERTIMKRKMRHDFEQMVLPNVKRLAELRGPIAAELLPDNQAQPPQKPPSRERRA